MGLRRATCIFLLLFCYAGWVSVSMAGKVPFLESFALSSKRQQTLRQLEPGSSTYLYYRILLLQQQKKWQQAARLLARSERKLGGQRYRQLSLRQLLLPTRQSPDARVAGLRRFLKLSFPSGVPGGQKHPKPQGQTSRPSTRKRVAFKRAVLRHERKGLNRPYVSFSNQIRRMIQTGKAVSASDLRTLLSDRKAPDVPSIIPILVKAMKQPEGKKLRELAFVDGLHTKQLSELLRLYPKAKTNRRFVKAYLAHLHDMPMSWDMMTREERRTFLVKMWGLTRSLPKGFVSLKQRVLCHLLQNDLATGRVSSSRLLALFRLPTKLSYRVSRNTEQATYAQSDIHDMTGLPACVENQQWVSHLLARWMRKGRSIRRFSRFLSPSFRRVLLARTRLLQGRVRRRWIRMLGADAFRRLKKQVILRFSPTNPRYVKPSAGVRVRMELKKVGRVLLKVYQLDALVYHKKFAKKALGTLPLGGMVPHATRTYRLSRSSMRLVEHTFSLPSIRQRGLYLVEVIGEGKVARALIQKGRLFGLERLGVAGHVFRIVDEEGTPLPGATIRWKGRVFRPRASGELYLPYTRQAQKQTMYLQFGRLVSPFRFDHKRERYTLKSGFYVDRESLLSGHVARVLVRPTLQIHGERVTNQLLQNVTLTMRFVDLFGMETSRTIKNFAVFDEKESVASFRVPARTQVVTFTLRGSVALMSERRVRTYRDSRTFRLNDIDRTASLFAFHLAKSNGHYFLSLRDRNGKRWSCQHRVWIKGVIRSTSMFRFAAPYMPDRKPLDLGPLRALEKLHARCKAPNGTTVSRLWTLRHNRVQWPKELIVAKGASVGLPLAESAVLSRERFALFRVNADKNRWEAGYWLEDAYSLLTLSARWLSMATSRPGSYMLIDKVTNARVKVIVGDATLPGGWIRHGFRVSAQVSQKRLFVRQAKVTKTSLVVQLGNATSTSRVHVYVTRFTPRYDLFGSLFINGAKSASPVLLARGLSQYASGRSLNREERYILSRQYARKYPGNMLPKPGLLLQPWTRRPPSGLSGGGTGGGGAGYGRGSMRGRGSGRPGIRTGRVAVMGGPSQFPNLDYLAHSTRVFLNVRPDPSGKVVLARRLFGDKQHIRILAVQGEQTVFHQLSTEKQAIRAKDLRLKQVLPAQSHWVEASHIKKVLPGQQYSLSIRHHTQVERLGSLQSLYQFFTTLNRSPVLRAFSFLTKWDKLPLAKKKALYSRYLCHELHLFLWRKDRAFFRAIVEPHLRNKMHKTFVDEWLLGLPLSKYRSLWRFRRLNVVEKILLAVRIPAERPRVARWLRFAYEREPSSVPRFSKLFAMVLNMRQPSRSAFLGKMLGSAGSSISLSPSSQRVAPTKTGEAWVHQTIARLGRSLRQQGLSASRKAKLEALLGFWKARLQMKQLYQPLGPVAEWAETHYYQIPRKAQRASLIRPNRFWLALSRHRSGPFLSRYVVEASMHVNEMLLALAFVDLPYRTSQPISRMVGKKLTIRARTPMLLFARTIRAHAANLHAKDVLVRHYCYSRGKHSIQKKPKWQVMKLTSFSVVTCRAMVLNASNKARVFAVLMQLPKGAMPVSGSRSSYHLRVRLGGFQSRSFVYSFAFLAPGRFHQFPVHVSEKGRLVGYTKPFLYQVRAHTPQSNMRGWETIARFGKKREVLAYLRTKPIAGLAFGALSGRLSRRSFFLDVLAILKRRGVYAEAVWKHAFVHRYVPGIRTYLRFSSRVSSVIGGWFDSPWFSFDPIERSVYEFLEYSPLVYPRAHVQPGLWRRKHQDMLRHYKQLLKHLALKPRRDWASDDLLQVAYYLLLQGRMTEAIRWFRRVKTRGLATRLQYDYFRAYLQMTLARPERARAIALPYRAYPVKRWRRLFQMVLQHARESRQSAPTSRRARQALVLSTNQTPELRFSMFGSTLYIHARRTKRVTVSYHLMDVEWLFSRHPFGARYARGVRLLRPNATQSFRVSQKGMLRRRLPASLRNRNVMITVRAGSVSKRRLYYANSMLVSINPMTGIIDVRSQRMGRKLSKVYIKVYAKTGRYGRHTFYKDGYTDLRGKFQYLSRNDELLRRCRRFSILILSPRHGAMVRTVAPPSM